MVEIKLDEAALARLDGAAKAAALETVEAVKTDLVSSQTMTARRPGGCIIIRSTISSAGRTQTPGPPGTGLMKRAGRKKDLSPTLLRRG